MTVNIDDIDNIILKPTPVEFAVIRKALDEYTEKKLIGYIAKEMVDEMLSVEEEILKNKDQTSEYGEIVSVENIQTAFKKALYRWKGEEE